FSDFCSSYCDQSVLLVSTKFSIFSYVFCPVFRIEATFLLQWNVFSSPFLQITKTYSIILVNLFGLILFGKADFFFHTITSARVKLVRVMIAFIALNIPSPFSLPYDMLYRITPFSLSTLSNLSNKLTVKSQYSSSDISST